MKTREEVETLKADWLRDGCWDLHTTEGFEEYGAELKEFEDKILAERRASYEEQLKKKRKVAPAFPLIESEYDYGASFNGIVSSGGLTKRELFAALALQGLLSNVRRISDDCYLPTAQDAVKLADALLEELAK
jgi:hypothetical protein